MLKCIAREQKATLELRWGNYFYYVTAIFLVHNWLKLFEPTQLELTELKIPRVDERIDSGALKLPFPAN